MKTLCRILSYLFMRSLVHSSSSEAVGPTSSESGPDIQETHLARVVASLNDVIWTIDMPSRKTIYVSAGVERVFKTPAQAFLDDPLLWVSYIHPADKEKVMLAVERILETPRETLEYRVVLPDGETRWMRCHASFTPGASPDSGWIDGITTDITKHYQTEEALRRSNRALRACDEVIARAEDEQTLFQGICDVMVKAGYSMAWAGVMDPHEDARIVPVGVAGEHHENLEYITAALETRGRYTAIIEQALRSRKPAIETRANSHLDMAAANRTVFPCHSKIVIPFVQKEQTVGLLNVYSLEENAFNEDEVDLLNGLAQSLMLARESIRHRSAFRNAEAALRLRQRAIEACTNPIVILSAETADRVVEYVNPAFERITGYAEDELLGRNLDLLIGDDLDQPGLKEIRAALDQQCEGHAVLREYRKDGSWFWSDIYVAPVRNDAGIVSHFVSVRYDITATKQYEAELAFQANYDKLTGLPNRNLLQDRLNQAIALSDRYGRPVCVMILDLDSFKFINSSLGHSVGDLLLQKMAKQLQSAVRQTDTVAHMGGDKFVLVMQEVSNPNAATSAVQRVMETVKHPIAVDGRDYVHTCSVGIALYPTDGGDAETLIQHANCALHRAKELKRSNFQFYTPIMNERANERLRLQGDLHGALQRNEFVLHYQPQVNLHTGRIAGMEALVRWQHPELGLVSPANFIGIAEETGLIIALGDWVLHTACLQAKKLHDAGYSDLHVAVNLSTRQFQQPELVPQITRALEEAGLDARYLDIEITESLVMNDIEHAVEKLHKLKSLGVKLSIDDFGTGYSSLSYLNRFPIDFLKIDRSFMDNITTDPNQAAIALSIISLAHSLRLQVVAEGVETEEQLGYLRRHNCDQIQGFYFSQPLPADAFQKMLEEGKHLLQKGDAGTSSRPTMLILDDEVNITAALVRLLRQDGYSILRAHTPEDAFALLALHDVQVILSDQLMPTMNGTQFLSKVKELYPDTIRIILSGYTGVDSIIDSINSGAVFRFHTKPWDDDALRESIAEAFRFHRLMRKQVQPTADLDCRAA